MKRFLGYSRDHKGSVVKRHARQVANTIHTATGTGGNTDTFIIEIYRAVE